MSKVRMYILAAVATAGIGLGGTFGASAVPINGKLIGATAPAPELHKIYYYDRHARRHYRRAYNRGYYGIPYGGLVGGGYCNRGYCGGSAMVPANNSGSRSMAFNDVTVNHRKA